jgi:hypothetical protein
MLFDGKKFTIHAKVEKYYKRNGEYIYINLHSISQAMYAHYSGKSIITENQVDKDLFKEPNYYHTNITNGLGIFATYSTSTWFIDFDSLGTTNK